MGDGFFIKFRVDVLHESNRKGVKSKSVILDFS